MDINKADYGTVIKFGNLELFKEKMKLEKHNIDEVLNIIDKNGVSLLEKSLIISFTLLLLIVLALHKACMFSLRLSIGKLIFFPILAAELMSLL